MNEEDNTLAAARALLFATLRDVRAGTMPLDQARAINEIGKTLIDTGKLEVDYLRVTGRSDSGFIQSEDELPKLNNGISGIVRHRLAG